MRDPASPSTLLVALCAQIEQVILLNTELSRSNREKDRLRCHVRQLEAELKVVQRRAAAGRVQAHRDGSPRAPVGAGGTSSRASSRSASAERWCPPRDKARDTSRSSSRAPSVASSSTAASRAGSVERGSRGSAPYANARARSAEVSRPTSRARSAEVARPVSQARSAEASQSSSLAHSRERSRPGSRSSSAERSRPSSCSGASHPRRVSPSIQRAATEALLQPRHQRKLPHAHPSRQPSTDRTKGRRLGEAVAPARQGSQANEDTSRRPSPSERSDDSVSSGPDEDEWSALVVSAPRRDLLDVKGGCVSDGADTEAQKENDYSRTTTTSQDIQDIDRRLSALQTFLKSAKVPR